MATILRLFNQKLELPFAIAAQLLVFLQACRAALVILGRKILPEVSSATCCMSKQKIQSACHTALKVDEGAQFADLHET